MERDGYWKGDFRFSFNIKERQSQEVGYLIDFFKAIHTPRVCVCLFSPSNVTPRLC